jgi:5'-methylthioadenosine phosphorylase
MREHTVNRQSFDKHPRLTHAKIGEKTMTKQASIAVIGGSGLYHMADLKETKEYRVKTPFGKTSAPIVVGTLEDTRVAFLARHGKGHHLTPGEVPYRANIFALKSLGVERIISVNACGSLREDYAPGHIVIPDNLFDQTKDRSRSFFGGGLVAHIGVANPFCSGLSAELETAVRKTGAVTHKEGSFIIIEGPRFSTKAESHVFRNWGMSIIGMTAAPEAFLAREAEICYAVMAHVTDYDVWHESESPVTVEMIIQTLNKNTQKAQEAIRNLVRGLKAGRSCECGNALATALLTDPRVIPPETRNKLDLLVGKYLK